MNRRRYKQSNHRKRRIRNIIIFSAIAAVLIFTVFMIAGLSLSEKTKPTEFGDDFEQKETKAEKIRTVQKVNAYPLPLLEDGSSFSSRLSATNSDATAVCVALNKPNGTLQYRSELASSLSYLTLEADASTLSRYTEELSDRDLYTTAVLYVPTFNDIDNELLADVELSIWGSIVCEAIREGVGDVLLIAPSASEDDVDKLCAIADRIHVTEKNAVVGLAIPQSVLDAEKSSTLIDTLSKSFDYLALDLTSPPEDETTVLNYIEETVSDMQLQLMYYEMRVLLPRGASSEELAKFTEIVTKYNIKSWQALPY